MAAKPKPPRAPKPPKPHKTKVGGIGNHAPTGSSHIHFAPGPDGGGMHCEMCGGMVEQLSLKSKAGIDEWTQQHRNCQTRVSICRYPWLHEDGIH